MDTKPAQPDSYPTTSDISMFMQELGFKWSNDAQIFYHQNSLGYEHLSDETAKRLYKYLIGDKPYSLLKCKCPNNCVNGCEFCTTGMTS